MVRPNLIATIEAVRTRMSGVLARLGDHPRARSVTNWTLALSINALLALVFLSVATAPPPRGTPDAPNVVTVFVVPPPAPSAPEEPEVADPETAPDPLPDVLPESELPPAAPSAVIAEDRAAPPPPTIDDGRGTRLPDVALPQTDPGQGTPDGLVALNCYAQFADPDKAAECAGREVLSGWRAEIAEIGPSWDKIAEDMRRAGAEVPNYGPDQWSGLGPNERLYRPDDPRFVPEGPSFLPRYAESFATAQEYREYQRLKDFRRTNNTSLDGTANGYGIGETTPLSGWQPSWQLRDDPNIDSRALEGLVEDE